MTVTKVGRIESRVRKYRPKLIKVGDCKSASVALILRNLDTTAEMFFIERAENKNDPWSGQIAFPGGNSDRSDQDSAATARRETEEEVGITLAADSQLARLNDQLGRHNNQDISLIISCFVFNLDVVNLEGTSINQDFFVSARKSRTENRSVYSIHEDLSTGLTPQSRKKTVNRGALEQSQVVSHSPEVGDSFWIGVDYLLHPNNQTQYQTPYAEKPYPGILLPSGKILWGLTYRFVAMFLTVIDS